MDKFRTMMANHANRSTYLAKYFLTCSNNNTNNFAKIIKEIEICFWTPYDKKAEFMEVNFHNLVKMDLQVIE